MKEENKFVLFFKGGVFPEIENGKKNKNENEKFAEVYKKLIRQSVQKPVPEFDAFEKLNKKRTSILIRRLIPYAAIFLIALGITSGWFFYSKQKTVTLNKQQIAEVEKNTIYALSYFSNEWKKSMQNFKKAGELNKPLKEFNKLKIKKTEPNNIYTEKTDSL